MKNPAKTPKIINLAYIFRRNKRDFSAKSLSLLLLALRPRLFRFATILPIITIFSLLYIVNFQASNVSATSITLTIPSQLSLNITPSISGTFSKSTPGSIGVTTDGKAGYTLSIKSSNGSNNLKHSNGNDKLTSITTNLTEDSYKSSGNLNTWGWLPSKLYDTQSNTSKDNTNFLPGPTSEDTIIDKTEAANSDKANNYTITLGSKVDNNIPSGNYSNTFIISASANTLPYDAIMQDWDGCEALGTEETVKLLDNRDDNIYTVSKLKDGKCWMTQNLKIGSNDSTTPLSPDNTDIAEAYTLPQGSTTGFSDDSAQNIYITPSPDENNYGGYYTWNAATANSGFNMSSGEASHSICPKGWRLPTNTDFNGISNGSYTDSAIQQPPANFVLAGYYLNGSLYDQGKIGYWWPSTAASETFARYMFLAPSEEFTTGYTMQRKYGLSLRCVSRSTDPTMQNVETWADSVQKGQSLEGVVDTRDGNTYTVARLNDGKLWMTQNLRLGGDKPIELTSSDSDVSSSWELPASISSGFDSYTEPQMHYDSTYGGYYNWVAATAGTNPSSGKASSSICPKGWHLPTGGSGGEFCGLVQAYGGTCSNTTQADVYNAIKEGTVPNFRLSGSYRSISLYETGSHGYWWSSTEVSTSYAYALRLDSNGSVLPRYSGDRKSYGDSVRCVAR